MCSIVLFVGLAYAQAFSMQIPADLFNEYGLLISVPIGVLVYISDECCGTSSHNSLNASLHLSRPKPQRVQSIRETSQVPVNFSFLTIQST